jgi:hypothetical protein
MSITGHPACCGRSSLQPDVGVVFSRPLSLVITPSLNRSSQVSLHLIAWRMIYLDGADVNEILADL